jgi:hypothetical protein
LVIEYGSNGPKVRCGGARQLLVIRLESVATTSHFYAVSPNEKVREIGEH